MGKKGESEKIWDARMQVLESAFGKCDETLLHAAVPFDLGLEKGGSPDIVSFSNFTEGTLYVTAQMIGNQQQMPNSHGNYELAIAQKGDEDWGVDLICRLAYYTLNNVIDHGETMDIREAIPNRSAIEALLFKRIASFDFQGTAANVICAIGITEDELELCFSKDTSLLFDRMPKDYIQTDLFRGSFLNP